MSIFNVGTGREPAEIGVAEYQKPDYQQFEKLANVNMQLKQAELEKAQKKTKEWGDILSTDFSTKYSIEQSRFVQKKIQAIKDKIAEKYKQNSNYLNDPVAMMEAKAELNQIKGFVGALDNQYATAIKDREEVEKDTKGIMYDKPYAIEYFNAQDNPLEYYNKNPNTEFGKKLGGIINSPEIQAIQDIDEKRFAIRSAMQAMPKKQGTIATNTNYTGGDLGFDIYDASSNAKGSNRYSRVSEVSAYNKAMDFALKSADSNANKTFAQIIGDNLEQQYGSNFDAYKQQLKAEYADKYNKFNEQYKGDGYELPRETLNSMTPPDKLTDDQLFAFEYAKHTAPSLMKKAEMSNTKNIITVNAGNGAKNATNSNTINTVFKLPTQGRFSDIDITTTTIDPLNTNENVIFNNIYSITGGGYMQRQESSTTTGNLTAPMGQVQVGLLPVHIGKKDKSGFPVPLTSEEQKDMVSNPNNWRGKVAFKTSFMSNSITTQDGSKKIDSSVAFASENMKALNTIVKEAKKQGFKQFIPTKPDYSFDEGLKYYNDYKSIQAPKSF